MQGAMSLINLLAIIWIIGLTVFAVDLARYLFREWLNPLSLYSCIWALCLCAYETHLIRWHPVSPEAWAYMLIAWVSIFGGAATVLPSRRTSKPAAPVNIKRLRNTIVLLSLIGLVGIVDQVLLLIRNFGGLSAALFLNAAGIYMGRIAGELNWIPYVGSSVYAACTLGGIYTINRG